jgi:dipeptidyl aminopeptidase/acylaminoacyl peptidase
VSGPVGAEDHVGIYVINVIGATVRKLRDDALGAKVSGDGSRIAFHSHHKLMVMNADGEQAHEIYTYAPEDTLFDVEWSPDGRRIVYARVHQTEADPEVTLENRDANGGTLVTVLKRSDIRGVVWLTGDRLLFVAYEPAPRQDDMNLWEARVDAKTGARRGEPKKLTDWSGFNFSWPSATSDGKHLAFVNEHDQGDIYVGELGKNGTELKSPVRLTLSEKNDWIGGWMPDGKSLLFYSARNGNFELYRQKINERSTETLNSSSEEKRSPQMSPDGNWIVYLSWPRLPNDAQPASGRLMRLPVAGGPAEPIFDVPGYATWGSPGDVARNLGDVPGFRCDSSKSGICVLVEGKELNKKLTITPFDPATGKKGKSTAAEVQDEPSWALSPDGSQIALTWFDSHAATIRIVPVAGGASHDISVKNVIQLVNLGWAADGKSLFAIRNSARGSRLLHVDMSGNSQEIGRAVWDIFQVSASPDGKSLAYGAVNSNSNVWMIPSLP